MATYDQGDPWLDDGNIILLADNDVMIPVAFKVHRGALARQSEVFRNIFGIPQPQGADSEFLEGCPVVPMHDNPSELSRLLRAIYDGITFHDETPDGFLSAVGIWQLADKYDAPRLRDQALLHLTQTWPWDLQASDRMVEKALSRPLVDGLSYPFLHPVHILNFARQYKLRLLMPSALYFLSCYSLEDILKQDHPKFKIEHPSRPSSVFPKDDELERYTLMYQHRLNTVFQFTYEFLPGQAYLMGCESPALCERAFARMVSKFQRSFNTRASPLYLAIQALREAEIKQHATCDSCRQTFRVNVTEFREKFWQSLPSVAQLPDWGVLVAADLPGATLRSDFASTKLAAGALRSMGDHRVGEVHSSPPYRASGEEIDVTTT